MIPSLRLAALVCGLAILTGLPRRGLSQPAPVARAMAPGIEGVEPLAAITNRHLFGPILTRGANGRLHTQFSRGEDHLRKGLATVGYALSDDDGRSWSGVADAVAAGDPKIYDRLGSFGRARTGKLVTLFSRRMAQGQKPILFQTASLDEGRIWQAPRPSRVAAGDDASMKAGWLFSYGAIRADAGRRAGRHGRCGGGRFRAGQPRPWRSWTRHPVFSSARPNGSGMGLGMLDETAWIAVSRIGGPRNRMAQFITRDADRSWRPEGGLNLPEESDVNVAPMIDDVTIAGRKALLPSCCDRRPKVRWLRAGALARERSDKKADIVVVRIPSPTGLAD